MTEEKKTLLKNITESFMNKGFHKTTMDEIAADLRISKKTIYKYFPTKEILLNLIIHGIVLGVRKEYKRILQRDTSSVEKMLEFSNYFISMASRVNIKAILDIKRLGPQFWSLIEKLRAREIQTNFGKLIAQGQKEGYIIPFPKELILAVFVSAIQAVINPDFMVNNSFSMKQAGQMTLEMIFNGILTDEGKGLYKKLKAEQI